MNLPESHTHGADHHHGLQHDMSVEDIQGVLGISEHWAETFKLLGDPTRCRLLLAIHFVGSDHKSVSELAEITGVKIPTASAALRVMENLRVVKGEREGRQVLYRLVDERTHQLLHAIGSVHAADIHAHGE